MRTLVAVIGLTLVATACTADATTTTTAPIVTAPTTTAAGVTTRPATESSTTVAPTTTAELPSLSDVRVDVEIAADGFEQPIFATARPGDDRLYVADQPGRVYSIDLSDGDRTLVLDISDRVRFSGEQGLLGLAFHPGDSDQMFVHYSARDGATMIVDYRIGFDGTAMPGSARLILTHPQPASNHNGGMIAFGPDGYLYIGLGDGGGAGDQFGNGQDPFSLLGTILRIDVDSAAPYAIPPDNPFADGANGAPEVWAWGLRNPWRFAFDGHDLWVADVGQAEWEEIDRLDAYVGDANAGWPVLEGTHCFQSSSCGSDGYVAPVAEYFHEAGRCSVTGGVVYRGTAIPELVGAYLFGDFCSGEVWALRGDDNPVLLTDFDDVFLPPLFGLTSFGIGPDGEVYLMQMDGLVWRLVPA